MERRGAGSLGVRDEDARRSRLAHFPPPFPILRYFQTITHTHTNALSNTLSSVASRQNGNHKPEIGSKIDNIRTFMKRKMQVKAKLRFSRTVSEFDDRCETR